MCSLLSQSLPQDSIKALQQLQEHMNCQNQLCNTACMDVSPKRRLKTTCRHSRQPQSLSLLSISSIVPAVDFLLHPQISTSLPTHSCTAPLHRVSQSNLVIAGCRAFFCITPQSHPAGHVVLTMHSQGTDTAPQQLSALEVEDRFCCHSSSPRVNFTLLVSSGESKISQPHGVSQRQHVATPTMSLPLNGVRRYLMPPQGHHHHQHGIYSSWMATTLTQAQSFLLLYGVNVTFHFVCQLT